MRLLFHDFEIPYLLQDEGYPVGGACIRQYAFARGLSELGHDVGILTWKGAGDLVDAPLDFELVESYSLDGGIKKIRWFTYRFPALVRAARSFQPDFLFQKSAATQTGVMALTGQLLRTPFIFLSTNNIDADDRLKSRLNPLERRLYQYGIRRASAIVCQNSYQYQAFKSRFRKKNLSLIKNPYYPTHPLTGPPTGQGRDYIAWIGMFNGQKNLPLLYDIVSAFPEIRFKIAGGQVGVKEPETEAAVARLERCPNAEFTGYLKRPEIQAFLSRAYCLLNTSSYEGFSNTFLESFAAGTPVVTFGENPDGILDEHRLGFIIRPPQAQTLFRTLQTDFDYADYCRRSRNYLKAHHDYLEISQQLIDLLTSLK